MNSKLEIFSTDQVIFPTKTLYMAVSCYVSLVKWILVGWIY